MCRSLFTRPPTSTRAAAYKLYIGGTGLFRSGDYADPYNRLALVILAARDQIDPVLRENRQLVLDIDGEMFRTLPVRDPRIYSFGRTGYGYTETVIVPIDLGLLTRLAQARSVREESLTGSPSRCRRRCFRGSTICGPHCRPTFPRAGSLPSIGRSRTSSRTPGRRWGRPPGTTPGKQKGLREFPEASCCVPKERPFGGRIRMFDVL